MESVLCYNISSQADSLSEQEMAHERLIRMLLKIAATNSKWALQFIKKNKIMDKQSSWLGCLLLAIGLLFTSSSPTQAAVANHSIAQTPPAAASAAPTASPTQPVDVVVLLDDSGSMATCWPWPPNGGTPFHPPCSGLSKNPPSDPGELRYSAARLLVQLADDADRIAVVRFDSGAEGVGALGALQPVGPVENRLQLAQSLQAPADYASRGYTRFDLGLDAVANLLQSAREPGRDQYVLLLTDGEPTQPKEAGDQGERVQAQMAALKAAGVFVFPIVLCNPSAGCAGDFLRKQFAKYGVREAGTAQDLLRVFSNIFAEIKPDRSVISGDKNGALQLTTRAAHGVRRMTFVTPRGGLLSVNRDNDPALTQNVLNDPNIDVNLVQGDAPPPGKWSAATGDRSGFVVVQTDSYPELLSPPPSIANSPASVHYYPAGKPLLLIARSNGPGAAEELLYNGKTALKAFGQDNTKMLLLKDEKPSEIKLQLGNDTAPLQLVRSFQLEPRADLPQVAIFSPQPINSGLTADGHAHLQVGFSGNAGVQNLAATAYVTDESNDQRGRGKLVYQAGLLCDERLCTDDNFVPGDGRSYKVIYVVEGQKDGIHFGDWGQAELSLKPAIALTGLPTELDLAQMPVDGWPVAITVGTTEKIGALNAALTLKRVDTGEVVPDVALNFAAKVPDSGALTTTLRVDHLETVRPGEYIGEITLTATKPNGKVMDVQLRPGAKFPVTFKVARPVARVDGQMADFGDILFDTSPNFRLNQDVRLPIAFEGKPFKIITTMQDTKCKDLKIVAGALQQADKGSTLPLHLSSRGPVAPTTCTGSLMLAGPSNDYDVFPQKIDWQMRVNNVEWSLVSSALNLGDLQDAGQEIKAQLAVRFNGKTPFVLQLADLQASGRGPNGDVTLSTNELSMSPIEINGKPTEAGLYEVPVTLVVRQAIPRDQVRGTFYTGKLGLNLVGLQGEAKNVDFNFRSPSIAQRYVLPYVAPIYSMPLALCTGPLTVLLLLVVIARWRGRSIDENEFEEAATAAVNQNTVAPLREQQPIEPVLPSFATPASDAAWGNAEWGSALGTRGEAEPLITKQPTNGLNGNGMGGGDPWKSNW